MIIIKEKGCISKLFDEDPNLEEVILVKKDGNARFKRDGEITGIRIIQTKKEDA